MLNRVKSNSKHLQSCKLNTFTVLQYQMWMLLGGDTACDIALNVSLSWSVVNDQCSVWIHPSVALVFIWMFCCRSAQLLKNTWVLVLQDLFQISYFIWLWGLVTYWMPWNMKYWREFLVWCRIIIYEEHDLIRLCGSVYKEARGPSELKCPWLQYHSVWLDGRK